MSWSANAEFEFKHGEGIDVATKFVSSPENLSGKPVEQYNAAKLAVEDIFDSECLAEGLYKINLHGHAVSDSPGGGTYSKESIHMFIDQQ